MFGLFDSFPFVFQLFFCFVFGFVWVTIGFLWLFLVVLVAWVLCVVVCCVTMLKAVRLCENQPSGNDYRCKSLINSKTTPKEKKTKKCYRDY